MHTSHLAPTDPSTVTVIPARSHRQAMDWSLVLASQGIDTSIEHAADPPSWSLLVGSSDHQRALDAIRQYRVENRRWNWRRTLPQSGLTWHGGALLWAAFLCGMHYLAALPLPGLADRGVLDSNAVSHGQWFRLATAIWLHGDVGHLASNAVTGILLLGLAMARYGGSLGLLSAFLAGLAGNLAGFLLHPKPFTGLGASGMVMGALGLVAAQSVALWHESPRPGRFVLAGVGAGGFLFLLLGTDPASDVLAHAGGFLAGLLIGATLSLLPSPSLHHPALRSTARLLLAALVAGTWILALR